MNCQPALETRLPELMPAAQRSRHRPGPRIGTSTTRMLVEVAQDGVAHRTSVPDLIRRISPFGSRILGLHSNRGPRALESTRIVLDTCAEHLEVILQRLKSDAGVSGRVRVQELAGPNLTTICLRVRRHGGVTRKIAACLAAMDCSIVRTLPVLFRSDVAGCLSEFALTMIVDRAMDICDGKLTDALRPIVTARGGTVVVGSDGTGMDLQASDGGATVSVGKAAASCLSGESVRTLSQTPSSGSYWRLTAVALQAPSPLPVCLDLVESAGGTILCPIGRVDACGNGVAEVTYQSTATQARRITAAAQRWKGCPGCRRTIQIKPLPCRNPLAVLLTLPSAVNPTAEVVRQLNAMGAEFAQLMSGYYPLMPAANSRSVLGYSCSGLLSRPRCVDVKSIRCALNTIATRHGGAAVVYESTEALSGWSARHFKA